ncbi:MAG: hypothetical protein AAF560_18215 [Acidobacteriota bacterium]
MSEAMGKILGMAMAYGVSSLGLLLAYVSYRRRTLGAERVMTGTAWAVIAAVLLSIAGGAWVVAELSARAQAAEPTVAAAEPTASSTYGQPTLEPIAARSAQRPAEERQSWPLIGMLLPLAIFSIATWVTGSLHRHFSQPHPESHGESKP